jgi:hypothetical protein
MRHIGAADSHVLMLIGAVLVIAASLLLDLPLLFSGLGAAAGFLIALPMLDALRERLGSTPALLAAAGIMLLSLKGFAGLG